MKVIYISATAELYVTAVSCFSKEIFELQRAIEKAEGR